MYACNNKTSINPEISLNRVAEVITIDDEDDEDDDDDDDDDNNDPTPALTPEVIIINSDDSPPPAPSSLRPPSTAHNHQQSQHSKCPTPNVITIEINDSDDPPPSPSPHEPPPPHTPLERNNHLCPACPPHNFPPSSSALPSTSAKRTYTRLRHSDRHKRRFKLLGYPSLSALAAAEEPTQATNRRRKWRKYLMLIVPPEVSVAGKDEYVLWKTEMERRRDWFLDWTDNNDEDETQRAQELERRKQWWSEWEARTGLTAVNEAQQSLQRAAQLLPLAELWVKPDAEKKLWWLDEITHASAGVGIYKGANRIRWVKRGQKAEKPIPGSVWAKIQQEKMMEGGSGFDDFRHCWEDVFLPEKTVVRVEDDVDYSFEVRQILRLFLPYLGDQLRE